ncbi:MAG: winged helix-turn-helix domain-containing protein [Clostridia bacterium]
MDKHLMAQMNKKNVIQCIDRFGPINRSAIAKMVGLSIPAVMDITEELIAHGLVTSAMREGSGQGKRPASCWSDWISGYCVPRNSRLNRWHSRGSMPNASHRRLSN